MGGVEGPSARRPRSTRADAGLGPTEIQLVVSPVPDDGEVAWSRCAAWREAMGPSEDHPFLKDAFVTPLAHASGRPLKLVHCGCYLWEEGVEDLGDPED